LRIQFLSPGTMYDIPPSWRGERRGNGEITEDYFEPAADVMCGSVGSIFCFLRLRRSDWDASGWSHEGRIVRILYIRRVFVSTREMWMATTNM
jgi:hypothetical protein